LSGIFNGPTVNTTGSLVEANDAAGNPPAFSNSISFTVTAVNPTVDAGGPYTGDVDTPIAIDGASVTPGSDASPSYLWAADLPGSFDNPTLLAPTFTPSTGGTYTLTLTVTPAAGYGDPVADTAALTSVGSVVTLFQWDSQYSGVPETITNGAITFTAADARTAIDNAGYVIDVPAGASADYGQRLVTTLLDSTDDLLVAWAGIGDASIISSDQWTSTTAFSDVLAQNGRSVKEGHEYAMGCTIEADTDCNVDFRLWTTGGISTSPTISLTANTPVTVAVVLSAAMTTSSAGFYLRAGTSGLITYTCDHFMMQDVTGLSNQAPQYVSAGVESAPYYNGAFADGVQYFPYANPNTVSNNILTENPPGPNYTSGFYCGAQGGWGISHFAGFVEAITNTDLLDAGTWGVTATLNTPVVDPAITAPDGTTNTWVLEVNSTGIAHIFQSAKTVIGQNTLHCFARPNDGWLRLSTETDGFEGYFDLTNGVTGVNNVDKIGMQLLGNGWYWCWITFVSTVTDRIRIGVTNDDTTTGANAGKKINVWRPVLFQLRATLLLIRTPIWIGMQWG
jgi:hypothetical protein